MSFIYIVTVLPLKLMFLNYCNFSRHDISCSNQTLSKKMPYCRRHEIVAMTLINTKICFNYKFIRLINVTKDCLFISKAVLIRKILSALHFYFNKSCFPLLVFSIMTFHVILSANAIYFFPGFLNGIYDRIHLNISMYKALPGQCSQCFDNFRGLLRKLKRATRHPRATSSTCVRYTTIAPATYS